jgi:cytochrome c oxidase subunit II
VRSQEGITTRRLALPALLAGLALLVVAPDALAGSFRITPSNGGGSPNAEHTEKLYIIVLILGLLIFLLVEGVLLYSIVKFRKRRDERVPAQVRGNTPLEISWTVGAAALLVVLAAVTFAFLGPIKDPARSSPGGLVAGEPSGTKLASLNQPPPPGPPSSYLHIHVNGQQFIWRYDYQTPNSSGLGQLFSYYAMYVPINTTVVLDVTSSDVVHSWWIPELGGKVQDVPGYTNHTWFRISQPGTYPGQCAQLCGKNHADMRAEVVALPVDKFKAWEQQQRAGIRQAQALLALSRRVRGGGP